MRVRTPTTAGTNRLHGWRAVCGALTLVLLAAVTVRGQTRTASVRVNVTVLDFAMSDVIGVHAIAASDQMAAGRAAGAHREGASWRITTGGGSVVGLRLESLGAAGTALPQAVSLCEVAAGPSACRPAHLPATRVTSAMPSSEWLLRLGESLRAEDGDRADRIVRLTIDYVGT